LLSTLSLERRLVGPAQSQIDSQTGQGLRTLRIEPPLEVLPLYVRSDSILPMGPDMAYVGEKPFDPVTLDIWLTRVCGVHPTMTRTGHGRERS